MLDCPQCLFLGHFHTLVSGGRIHTRRTSTALLTRWAAAPLIITMLVAITATKIPIWMGRDWVVTESIIFYLRELKTYGFWSFMHEARLDWAMLMNACYLFAVGGGQWSLDKVITQQNGSPDV